MLLTPQVMLITLANESKCEDFKGHFQKFDYLWKKDLAGASLL